MIARVLAALLDRPTAADPIRQRQRALAALARVVDHARHDRTPTR